MDYLSIIGGVLATKKTIASPSANLSLWKKLYSGEPVSWHKYTIYNGKKNIHKTRLSMRMAKQVAEDWASLLMNERVEIGVKSQEQLEKDLMRTDFWNRSNKAVEYAFGLSMSALVVDIDNLEIEMPEGENVGIVKITEKTKANINIYSALKIIPINFENGNITECAFIQENTKSTKVVAHILNEIGEYEIIVATTDTKTGAVIDICKIETMSEKPLFAIIYPQIVNNIDLDSPYPIPIYANAIDTLKSIDYKYDSYANEFLLGRKRIFVSSEINQVNKDTGEVECNFDTNDAVFSSIPKSAMLGANNGNPFIYVSNDALRSAEHSQAIQDDLNFFSKQCGLGVDYYRFEKGRVMTATQVISEKSDTFRNLKKHEGVVEKALFTIIHAFMYATNTFTLGEKKYEDIENITVKFDDSIIEDKNTEKSNDQKEVEFGVMSLIGYRMKWFAEDEKTAKKYVEKIYGDADLLKRLANYTPFLTQGVLTALEFVKKVYIDIKEEDKQIALAEEIKENLKTGSEVFSDADLMNLRGNENVE